MNSYRENMIGSVPVPEQKHTPSAKSPVGPATVQVRGFSGMPKPDEVKTSQKPVQKQNTPGQTTQPVSSTPGVVAQNIEGKTISPQGGMQKQNISPAQTQPGAQSPEVTISHKDYTASLEGTPKQVEQQQATPRIRTFKSDATGYIKENQVTKTQMAIAEQKRQQEEMKAHPEPVSKSKKISIIVFTVLFLLIAGGIFAVVLFNPTLPFIGKPLQPEQIQVPELPEILPSVTGSKNVEYVELDNTLSYSELGGFFDPLLKETEKAYLFVEEDVDGNKVLIFPSAFFDFIRAYEIQEVAFAFQQVEYGVRNNHPYLLFVVNDFSKVYPEIFAWEDTLIEQMEPLFPSIRQREEVRALDPLELFEQAESGSNEEGGEEESGSMEVLSDTQSGEKPVPTQKVLIDYRGRTFVDKVYKNQNIRVALDDNGAVLLYHTFIDDAYVLIGQELELIPYMIKALTR